MTEKLTRAHRREIENKTKQKIDLDHLSEFNVDQLVSNVEEVPQAAEESSDEASSSSEEEDSEEEDSEDDEEEDSDALLNKAQAALKVHSIELEKKEKPLSTSISQMKSGISVDKELYFKTNSGKSKLVTEAVELLSPGEKASKKSAVTLQANKDEDSKKMNKKQRQLEREKTAGSAWFDMPKTEMTDEIRHGQQTRSQILSNGTIIESPTEFFSARMNKKERKATIVDELLASDDQKQYYKRKFNEVQDRTNSGGKKHFKKLKAQRQWAK
ncbi:unnamed protein product [Mucor hiemalis]